MKTAFLLLLSNVSLSGAFNASIRLTQRPGLSSTALSSAEQARQVHDEGNSDNPIADLYRENQQRIADENEILLKQLEEQQARYEKPKEETLREKPKEETSFVFDSPSGAAMDPDEYQWYMRSRLEKKFREPC